VFGLRLNSPAKASASPEAAEARMAVSMASMVGKMSRELPGGESWFGAQSDSANQRCGDAHHTKDAMRWLRLPDG
jgi:hypothetical protein